MGQGTTTAPQDANASTAGGTATPGKPALTDQQVKAISMLMGQMGKGAPAVAGMSGQVPRNMPQISTMQGGTYFNPQQPR